MQPGLWLLLYLRTRAAIRLRMRDLRSVRGWAYLALVGTVLVSITASRTLSDLLLENLGPFSELIDPEYSENVFTALLLGLCLLTLAVSSGPPVYFGPSGRYLLFSGPFSRRELLMYKLLSYIAGVVLTAGVVGLLASHQSGFSAVFWGMLNAMLFVQLLATSVSLVDLKMRDRGFRHFRSTVIGVVFVVAAFHAWLSLQPGSNDPAGLGIAVTLPFRVFVRVITAAAWWPDLLAWGGLAATINLLLIGLLARADIDYREAVIASSHQLHQRWVRAKRSGVWSDRRTTRWRLPFFPTSTIGLIAWRQMTILIRTFRGTLFKLTIAAVCAGPLLALAPARMTFLNIGICISLGLFLLPKVITFDFRSDWDYIMFLRSLPLEPWRISLAQLVTPVLVISLIEALAILSAIPFASSQTAFFLSWLLTILIPFNAMVYAVDNLLFLLFPAELTPVGRMDFEFFGRSLVEFFVRISVVVVALIAGILMGQLLAILTGNPALGMGIGNGLVFTTITALLIPGMAWAFRRFDDGPDQ